MKAILGMAAAVALIAPVRAAPTIVPNTPGDRGSVLLVEGGCGPYAHRDYNGYCRPNGPPAGYYAPGYYDGGYSVRWTCPPGWHFGGGRCWPNG
jgi:hypothetical protein